MAGRRLSTGGGRPRQRRLSAERRRQALTDRLATARTAHESIQAAAAYAISAAKAAPPANADDIAAVTETVQQLVALGDQLLQARRKAA